MGDTKTPKTVTVVLEDPIVIPQEGGGEIVHREFTFHKMRMKDTLAGEGEQDKTLAGYKLYASMARIDIAVFLEVTMEDMEVIMEKVMPLLGKSGAAAMRAAQEEMKNPIINLEEPAGETK